MGVRRSVGEGRPAGWSAGGWRWVEIWGRAAMESWGVAWGCGVGVTPRRGVAVALGVGGAAAEESCGAPWGRAAFVV